MYTCMYIYICMYICVTCLLHDDAEAQYGVTSNYNEEFYTTKLDVKKVDPAKMKRAEVLARVFLYVYVLYIYTYIYICKFIYVYTHICIYV